MAINRFGYSRDQLIGFNSVNCKIRRCVRKTLFALRLWRPASQRFTTIPSGQSEPKIDHNITSLPSGAVVLPVEDNLLKDCDVYARDQGLLSAATQDIGPTLNERQTNNLNNTHASQRDINFGYLNAQSIRNKTAILLDVIVE